MYITDLKAISPQATYNNGMLNGVMKTIDDTVFLAEEPNYLEFIPKGLLRRMGKAVRMGIGTGLPLIKKHQDIEGIIIGTANGGLEDCVNFLNQIVEYEEGVLTPTNFVQSTPNAVAGLLALMSENRSYNTTYTNGGLSFESTILDALLLFEENKHEKLLIGGLDEISQYNYNLDFLGGKYKVDKTNNTKLLDSKTIGTICGEGATMFIVEKNTSDYIAKIVDVAQATYPTKKDLEELLIQFLKKNNLILSDIDSIMTGLNGDTRHNDSYNYISEDLLPDAALYSFKNLSGDYRTSSAFATWLSAHILNKTMTDLSSITLRKGKIEKQQKNILIYNHFDAIRHSFILLSK